MPHDPGPHDPGPPDPGPRARFVAGAKGGRGLLIGKFLPPHQGHRQLIDFARSFCDQVTVLVCSLAAEPIPGDLRCAWATREGWPWAVPS